MAFFITIFYLFDQFPNDFDMLDSLSVRVNRENRVAKSLFDSTWAHHSHFVCSASLTSLPPNLTPLCPSLNLLFLLLPLAACIKHLPSFSFIWIEKLFAAICYASLENKQEKNNQKKCKKKKKNHNETWCSKFVECLLCISWLQLHFAFDFSGEGRMAGRRGLSSFSRAFLFVINFVAAVKCNCICSHASKRP